MNHQQNRDTSPLNDQQPAQFPEQDAPNKNTDNAFVKVGRDGHPEIPTEKENQEKERTEARS